MKSLKSPNSTKKLDTQNCSFTNNIDLAHNSQILPPLVAYRAIANMIFLYEALKFRLFEIYTNLPEKENNLCEVIPDKI